MTYFHCGPLTLLFFLFTVLQKLNMRRTVRPIPKFFGLNTHIVTPLTLTLNHFISHSLTQAFSSLFVHSLKQPHSDDEAMSRPDAARSTCLVLCVSTCVPPYRITLEIMTLQPRCEDVETAEGVAITVTGVAQVRPVMAPRCSLHFYPIRLTVNSDNCAAGMRL